MMKWDRVEEDWDQLKGSFMRQWPRLSNIDVMTGKREWLLRNIREKYGITQHEAEAQLAVWQDSQTETERAA
jgi:uncharacterized protein YjbJ (UPF0337 family)